MSDQLLGSRYGLYVGYVKVQAKAKLMLVRHAATPPCERGVRKD